MTQYKFKAKLKKSPVEMDKSVGKGIYKTRIFKDFLSKETEELTPYM